MIVKTETSGLIKKLNRVSNNFRPRLKAELGRSSERIRRQAINRFTSFFNASKHADVLQAISQAGIKILQSIDGETSILLYDLDTMDYLTAQTSPATGRLHHLWRILHEGSGPRGARGHTNNRTSISRKSGFLQAPYHSQAIVQTTALRPFYEPGRYPPFADLVQLEGTGVKIIRSPGFEGHAWFLRNNDLFDEDRVAIDKAVDSVIKKVFK